MLQNTCLWFIKEVLWLFYEAIGGGGAGCCLYNCWGIRWVLTHLVRVCLKIDFIFLTVFCNFHSFTHCAWTCWKNKVFMKMWKIQQFGPCNILIFLLSKFKYFISLPGWLYYNYGYYCVCLLGWFIKIKEHENVYHASCKSKVLHNKKHLCQKVYFISYKTRLSTTLK